MSAFGTGSNSYGQFWFGGNTFPGFLFKKNVGVGGRRSTKFNPGGNITCNSPTYLYNKYKPGAGGVGASSMSNRRAKNRLATVCGPNQCFPCYPTLGQYSNYTHNPNGFIPCPAITSTSSSTSSEFVTYLGNGNTGVTTPLVGSSLYSGGTTVTFPPFLTTGGSTITYTSNTYIITFTTSGTMTFNSGITMPATVNYLLVGGGGGGGGGRNNAGGGGGGQGGQVLSTTNILGATPTTTLSFTVATSVAAATIGNNTICSGTGITTITASGGARGTSNSGGVNGSSGGGTVSATGSGGRGGSVISNGFGGFIPTTQGSNGIQGTLVSINSTNYYFGGGGSGGNNSTGAPAGGLGGGGGVVTSTGNGGTNPYTGPNSISQNGSTSGYINSGGGGAGGNAGTNSSGRDGGSGLVVVWFSYPYSRGNVLFVFNDRNPSSELVVVFYMDDNWFIFVFNIWP
jgi:hypothetical protein